MAQINGIEVKNFNPNAKTYIECIKNTQAIQREIDKRSFNSHLALADSNSVGEAGNRKLAKQLAKTGLQEQQRVNMLTKERKIWEKKAAQTPEGKKKEQKKFAEEQKLAGQEKTKNRIRKKIKAAFFPPICPKR